MPRTSSLIEQPGADPVMTAPVAVASAILAARFLALECGVYTDSLPPSWSALVQRIEDEAELVASLHSDALARRFITAALALCAPLRGAR